MLLMIKMLYASHFGTLCALFPMCWGIISMPDSSMLYIQCDLHVFVYDDYLYQTLYWCNILLLYYALLLLLGLIMSLHYPQSDSLMFSWIIHLIG
jgi:hypothetical protein